MGMIWVQLRLLASKHPSLLVGVGTDRAREETLVVTTNGTKPQGDSIVVSTMHMGTSVQYRLVGDLSSPNGAVSTEQSLEDNYVWLMREKRAPGIVVAS